MRASGYDRAANDWYTEPAWLIDALLDVEPFTGTSWDPAAGGGNIPERMKARDLPCIGTDLVARGGCTVGGVDFLAPGEPYARVANIVSNPPYNVIEPWIERALAVTTGKVAILARLAILEGQKRRALFKRTPLARVWVSSRRPSMPPGGTDVKASGGSIAFCWVVWDHSHSGAPTLGWLG